MLALIAQGSSDRLLLNTLPEKYAEEIAIQLNRK